MNLIDGVHIKQLVRHYDNRGFFEEIIRETDEFFTKFGQFSHSVRYTGEIVAWHIHRFQWDFWYVPTGIMKAALFDKRQDSQTYQMLNEFILGQKPVVLAIPPGVAHGFKVIQGPAHLFYITSEIYNPNDEGRISLESVGYEW